MPTTIPNPQNGSNNPYNPNTYSYNGGAAGFGQIYAGNGITSLTTNQRTVLELQRVNNELNYVFTGEENGAFVKMVLAPEYDLKPLEHFLLQGLITACSNSLVTCAFVMSYVRAHNLERHFKFSPA